MNRNSSDVGSISAFFADIVAWPAQRLAVPLARLGQTGTLKPGDAVFALRFEGGIARALHTYDGARVVESTRPSPPAAKREHELALNACSAI